MKAILILDEMPTGCIACRFSQSKYTDIDTYLMCLLNNRRLDEEYFTLRRPCFCPLKPLPQKIDTNGNYETDFTLNYYLSLKRNNVENAYEVGWNDCIDEIIGE